MNHMPLTNGHQYDQCDMDKMYDPLVICGTNMTIEAIVHVARHHRAVYLSDDSNVQKRMEDSIRIIDDVVNASLPLYGVTSLFGGLANQLVCREMAEELQNNLVCAHKAGAGSLMPLETIRGAMVLRANTHLLGASGIRRMWDERIIRFLCEDVTPLIPEFGSIGASGDLIPLSYIASAISGQDDKIRVNFKSEIINAPEALERLGMTIERFHPKEALAILNGTSLMTSTASIACYDLYTLMAATLHVHALAIQALHASDQPLHPFIHQIKGHKGQIDAAAILLDLIHGSSMVYDALDGQLTKRSAEALVQDRYSVRCSPQYIGPLIETLHDTARILEIEMNSANDNPLIDSNTGKIYCGGNFLGEHVAIAMDRLRHAVGLLAKHLDVQIAQVVTPAFSNGLPASLVGNRTREVNIGVKALQICGNSIMPYLLFLGNSLSDKYATHAEQYNQNINSMGHMSAYLARQAISVFCQYLGVCFLIFVQAIDLRAGVLQNNDNYDPRPLLSEKCRPVYEAIRSIINVPIEATRSYIWNDGEHALDEHIALIAQNITLNEHGPLFQALKPTIHVLRSHRYAET